MSKELKPKMWCRPSSEEEWSAILSIAVSLGLADKESPEYNRMPGVGVVSRPGKWRVGACAWPLERPHAGFPEVPVADFIASMYAEARRREDESESVDIESLTRRVKKLEQEWRVAERRKDGGVTFMHSRMIELADAMNEAGLAVGDHSRHAQMEERLKKLEEANSQSIASVAEVARSRSPFYNPKDKGAILGHGGNGWRVSFDPDASPSGVPFEVALMYAKLGRRISRKSDTKKDAMWVDGETLMTSHRHFYVSDEDLLANDWYVLPKEEKA